MKKVNKVLIVLLIMMIMPAIVNAAGTFEYSSGNNYAKEYIKKGNFRTTHDKYIKSTDRSHYIDKNEYEQTKNKTGRSYLFDGVEFWTNNDSSDHYYVNYSGATKIASSSSSKYNVKDVEYVKEDVKVRGSGTYANPWTFDPMYEVTVKTDGRYGHIVDPSGDMFSKTVFASRGEDVIMQLEKKSGTGYKYLTNDCGATYSNGYLKIENITRDLTCNVIFGIGKFKVTLNGATPEKIISSYRDNFYKYNESMNLREVVNKVNVPNSTGYQFLGYFYELLDENEEGETVARNITVVNPDGTLNRAATNVITDDIELDPSYDMTKPTVQISASGEEEKVYHSEDTTLTCTTSISYGSGSKTYYSFGYASSHDGTPSNWTTPSETNTYTISKTGYIGSRYYSCRVYGENTSTGTTTATTMNPLEENALVRYVNARITFDENGGELNGTSQLYTKYDATSFYTGATNTTVANAPVATLENSSFKGWFTEISGGIQVIDETGALTNNDVSGIRSGGKFVVEANKTLYAQYEGIPYTIKYALNKGTHGSSHPTGVLYGNEFTVSNPTKKDTITLKVESGITVGYSGSDFTKPSSGDIIKAKNYTFDGWKITGMDSSEHIYGDNTTTAETLNNIKETKFKNLRETTGTVTFTAQWTPPSFKLPTISKTGYTCVWESSDPSDIDDIASGGTFDPSTATRRTFEASCTSNTLTITLNKNGGKSGTSKIYALTGKGVYKNAKLTQEMSTTKYPVTPPYKDGYAFAGYYTAKTNGTKMIDKYGYRTSNLKNSTYSANATLYAQWTSHTKHTWKARGNSIYNVGFYWYIDDNNANNKYNEAYGIYCTGCHMSARYYQEKVVGNYNTIGAFVSPKYPYTADDGWTILNDSSLDKDFAEYKAHKHGYFPVVEKPK